MTENDRLAMAAGARLQGDHATAISTCRELLALDPASADAQSLLGVSLIETGQVEEGAKFVTQALNAEPSNWRFLLNISILYEAREDIAAALSAVKEAAKTTHDRFEVWGRLGNLFGMMGDFHSSADALEKALALNPAHDGVAYQLAAAKMEIQDLTGAKAAIESIKNTSPLWLPSLPTRTHIARQNSDWVMMVDAAEQWLNHITNDDPTKDEARIALSFGLNQQGYYDRAAEIYKPLTDRDPPDAEHLATLARLFLSARAMQNALHYYKKALAIDPENAGANLGMSRYFMFHGRLEEAEQHCRKAIASNPQSADAYSQLSEIIRGAFTDVEISALERIRSSDRFEFDQRAVATYAIGEAYHKRKERGKAFAAWVDANGFKLKHLTGDPLAAYDPHRQKKATSHLMNAFPSPLSNKYTFDPPRGAPIPIFIVGMPRSGTTLLESALAAHPDIAGAGELPVLPIIRDSFMEWMEGTGWREGPLPPADVAAWRERYFRQYKDYNVEPAKFVVDKLPQNFLSVGVIRTLFPEAKIIHIRRNPVETGFSIFRRNFTRHWTFSTSLENIGHYYGQYAKLMEHWQKIFSPDIAFIQYEELVQAFEQKLRNILAFCNIEWDDNCLEFYRADRTVITFSAVQVRNPPSTDHLNSSGPYADALQPLVNSLQREGVDLATGALIAPGS